MPPFLISDIAVPLFPEAAGRGRLPGALPPEIFDGELQPRPSDPVYLLIYPTDDVADQITRLGSRLGDRYNLPGRPTGAERVHTSLLGLCYFGQLTGTARSEINDMVSNLAMPPFVASFDLVRNFGRNGGPLVLCGDEGVIGVTMLHDELVTTTRMIGFRDQKRDFTPHITLNYRHCVVPEQSIDEIRWTVRELVLVCSLYGRHLHLVLARWPLRGPSRVN